MSRAAIVPAQVDGPVDGPLGAASALVEALIRAVPSPAPAEPGPPPAGPAPAAAEPGVGPDAIRSDPVGADSGSADPGSPDPSGADPGRTDPGRADRRADPDGEEPAAGRAPARRDTAGGQGVRERRRQETRGRIVDAAAELFAERGFDAVSVVEIARRAGVVEKTVFNHFPVKEGLVFDADPPVRGALLDAVRRRPAGRSATAAAGSFVVGAVSLLATREAAEGVAGMARVIRGSRTLQVREREILGELTEALAGLIAEETQTRPDQLEPRLAAHAVLGLYAGLLELARDRVLAGVSGPELAEELRTRGRSGLALLQSGLAGYARRN